MNSFTKMSQSSCYILTFDSILIVDFSTPVYKDKEGNSGNESHEFGTGRKMYGRQEYYIMTRDLQSADRLRKTVNLEKWAVRVETALGTRTLEPVAPRWKPNVEEKVSFLICTQRGINDSSHPSILVSLLLSLSVNHLQYFYEQSFMVVLFIGRQHNILSTTPYALSLFILARYSITKSILIRYGTNAFLIQIDSTESIYILSKLPQNCLGVFSWCNG